MTSFLLIISYALHIITIFIIYKLIQRIRTLKNIETSNIETMFNEYLEAFKEENRKLQNIMLEESKTVHHPDKDRQEVKDNVNSLQLNREEQKDDLLKKEEKYPSQTFINDPLPNVNSNNDMIELSLQSKILDLYNRGWNEEAIAKELNCGKTEVVLTIKMYTKIEQNT